MTDRRTDRETKITNAFQIFARAAVGRGDFSFQRLSPCFICPAMFMYIFRQPSDNTRFPVRARFVNASYFPDTS